MTKNNLLFASGLNSVIDIIKKATNRLSDHFIDYVKVYFAMIGLYIALGLALAGVSLGFFLIANALHLDLLYILVVPLILAFACAFVYLSTWCTLVMIDSIIGKTGITLKARFNAIRPYVVGYVWFNFWFGLFTFGLVPLGVITLGLAFLFWIIVSTFSAFVYLQYHYKNLDNLWVSKQMIKTQFWTIVLFFVAVYGIIFSIDIVLLKSNHPITHLTSWMLNFIAFPFFISLKYEVYRQIPHPKTIEKPKNWILASKIGFVLMIIGMILLINSAIRTYPTWKNLPENLPNQDFLDKSI